MLAVLCCLATLTAAGPETIVCAWPAPAAPLEGDDESEDGKGGSEGKAREEAVARRPGAQRPVPPATWRARRARRRDAAPGHPVAVCSPFARGAPLPLRC